MKVYRTTRHGCTIETIEAIKVEAGIVHFMYRGTRSRPIERQDKMVSISARYHLSFENAKAYLIERLSKNVKGARTRLESFERDLEIVEAMEVPK